MRNTLYLLTKYTSQGVTRTKNACVLTRDTRHEKRKTAWSPQQMQETFGQHSRPVHVCHQVFSERKRPSCPHGMKGTCADPAADVTPGVATGSMLSLADGDEGGRTFPHVLLSVVPKVVTCGTKEEKLIKFTRTGMEEIKLCRHTGRGHPCTKTKRIDPKKP